MVSKFQNHSRGEVEGLSIVWARKEGVAGRNGARQINGFSITKRKQKKFELMTRPSVHHRHRRLHLEPLVVRCLTDPVVNSLLVKSEKKRHRSDFIFLPIAIFRLLWQTHCTMVWERVTHVNGKPPPSASHKCFCCKLLHFCEISVACQKVN